MSLAIVAAVLGVLAWHALTANDATPMLSARVERIVASAAGHTVRVSVVNDSSATAAEVVVTGSLRAAGGEVRTSTMIVDFVPGHSRREGGLLFDVDPSAYELSLRVEGYVKP